MPPDEELPPAEQPKLFFENVNTGKRFEVIARDTARNTITLRGTFGDFTETYSKERFKELGYKPVQVVPEPTVPPEDTDPE